MLEDKRGRPKWQVVGGFNEVGFSEVHTAEMGGRAAHAETGMYGLYPRPYVDQGLFHRGCHHKDMITALLKNPHY